MKGKEYFFDNNKKKLNLKDKRIKKSLNTKEKFCKQCIKTKKKRKRV